MVDLHYFPTPNGWKVSIALEELGLPYRIVSCNIARGEQFEPAFLAISPNNRMPAIVDHDPVGGVAWAGRRRCGPRSPQSSAFSVGQLGSGERESRSKHVNEFEQVGQRNTKQTTRAPSSEAKGHAKATKLLPGVSELTKTSRNRESIVQRLSRKETCSKPRSFACS